MELNRESFDEAFMNLMSNPDYVNLSFYSFIISKMKISITNEVPTAGAGFYNNVFNLVINPDFFNTLSIEERIAVLVHECQHVILQHIFRKGERDHKLFNIACDIAINQNIENLPEGGMFPWTFDFPKNKTAEQYYELLKEEKENQEKEKAEAEGEGQSGEGQSGEGQPGEGEGQPSGWEPSNGHPDLTMQEELTMDDHSGWGEMNPEDKELAKDSMNKILEEAVQKSRGKTPHNIEELMEIWKKKPVISWKRVLKRFVSSKKGKKTSTIKRRDRRLPSRHDIKGKKTYYDQPEIIVGIDISGSMSDADIQLGLTEILEVAKISNSNVKVVQIDTDIQGLETLDKKSKTFTRRGCGGTYMGAMPAYLNENKIHHDVLIMITDGWIEDVKTDKNWLSHKKPVLWLTTSGDMTDTLKHHTVMDIHKA